MTPKELLKFKEGDYIAGMRKDIDTLKAYEEKDCVIAYRKSFLGVALIIRSKRDIFGFVVLNGHIRWGHNVEVIRKTLKSIQLLFKDEGEEKLIVNDEENFKVFERRVLLNAIENDE